jgi:signal transduction histidine kinase
MPERAGINGQFRNGGKMTAVSDDRDLRGLLHDLGHQLMTLSLLAESVGSDHAIRGESRRRIELVKQEMFRAMDMITDHLAVEDPYPGAASPDPLDLRDVASEAAQLAELTYGGTVELLPGQRATARVSSAAAWRVLSNLVDNAARSAGPGGHVQISVRLETGTTGRFPGSSPWASTIIDVLDDGPGVGRAPGGVAGIGLSVVRQLVDAAGGRLEVTDRPDGGTRARVVFGHQRESAMAPVSAGMGR